VCSCAASRTLLNSQTHLAEADQRVAVLVLPPQQVFTLQAGMLAKRLVLELCRQAGRRAGRQNRPGRLPCEWAGQLHLPIAVQCSAGQPCAICMLLNAAATATGQTADRKCACLCKG
jgi:hypothetical protein